MLTALTLSTLALSGHVAAWAYPSQEPNVNTASGTSAVEAAAATATSSSYTSNVKGRAFDRFVVIWMVCGSQLYLSAT